MHQTATPTVDKPEAPHGHPSTGFQLSTFSSLRYRDYRLFWFATALMSAGQWVQQVTLGWLLYDRTGSSVLLGALNGLRALPFLITGPIGGVVADQVDRRKLMLSTQFLLGISAALMGLLVVSGFMQVWHLFVFGAVVGIIWAFNQPVRQTIIPLLVPKEELMNAVALSSAAFNINKILGPTVGGLLIVSFGAGGNFFVQALAYAGVLVVLYFIVIPSTPARGVHTSTFSDLKEGLQYVKGDQMVLSVIIATFVMQVCAMPYMALLPVFQKDVLQMEADTLGYMLAAPGVGALLSTLTLATIAHRMHRKGRFMLVFLASGGLALIAFSQATSLPITLLCLAFVGALQIAYMSTSNTVLQLIVPPQLRGRVMSIYMLDFGLQPFGALFAGISTQFFGAPATVAFMGALVTCMALGVTLLRPQLSEWSSQAS